MRVDSCVSGLPLSPPAPALLISFSGEMRFLRLSVVLAATSPSNLISIARSIISSSSFGKRSGEIFNNNGFFILLVLTPSGYYILFVPNNVALVI